MMLRPVLSQSQEIRPSTLPSSSSFSPKDFASCLSQRFSSVVVKQIKLWLSRSSLELLPSTRPPLAKIARSRWTQRTGWGPTKLVVLRFLHRREKLRWTTPWRRDLQWSASRFSQACAASFSEQTLAGSSLTRAAWIQNQGWLFLATLEKYSPQPGMESLNLDSSILTLLLVLQRHLWFCLVI